MMKLDLINKLSDASIKSKKYAFSLAFALTIVFIFIGYVFFYNILNLLATNIEDLTGYQSFYYYGMPLSQFNISFPMSMFIYFEIIFSPILFTLLYKYICRGASIKFIPIFTIMLLILIALLLFLKGKTSSILSSILFIETPSVIIYLIILLLITIGVRFFYTKKRLFGLSLIGIPLYFILQIASPVVIFSEIDYLETSLNLKKYTDLEKVQVEKILIGSVLNSTNSLFVKKLSVQEDFQTVKYYNHRNKLNLTLPQYISSSEAYFLLIEENIESLCFQYKRNFWDKCFFYVKESQNLNDKESQNLNDKEKNIEIDTLVNSSKYNTKKYDRKFFLNIEDSMFNRARGWFFHHQQNFESPLYGIPEGKLPPSQYGPLALALMNSISSTLIVPFSNSNIFSLTIGAVQFSNMLGYLIILLLLTLLKIDDKVKVIVSLSILSGLVILLETSDVFAPGLSLFRIFPQLILVIFAFSQLSLKRQYPLYLSIPFVSIFIFPLLALYNEQFALFTVMSAVVSLMFSDKIRIKFLSVFFAAVTLILYWSFVKEYFVYMDVSSNSRMLNYITGLGWASSVSIRSSVLLGSLIISPLFYILITYSKDDKQKVNSIFVAMLSGLMFIKFIWNPSINHLASIIPFSIFPFIILFFKKNNDSQYNDLIIGFKNFRYPSYISTIREKLSLIDFTNSPRTLRVLKTTVIKAKALKKIVLKIAGYLREVIRPLSSKLKIRSSVYKSTIFALFILFMVSLIGAHSISNNNQNSYKYKYINNFHTDELFSFPRKVFVDSSFNAIVNDYSSLVENIDREIILLTKHDVMISMNIKKKIGSPYSDFSTNIVFQKDVDAVYDFLDKKNYCLVLDRRDQFYHLPFASENEMAVLRANNNSKLNIFSVFNKIKPTLKFVDQSKYFELHCSVLPKINTQ